MQRLSQAERLYIEAGVACGVRADGRGLEDFRPLQLETGLLQQASGSARLRLAGTDVLAGVKCEVAEPLPDRPAEGRLAFTVEWSALPSSPTRPPSSHLPAAPVPRPSSRAAVLRS